MNKKAIFTIITCSIAVVILTGALIVGLGSKGFGLGGLLEEVKEQGDRLTHKVNSALQKGGDQPGAVPVSTEEGSVLTYTWKAAEVTQIQVEWASGDVELKIGQGEDIVITETGSKALGEEEKLRLSGSPSSLKIKWKDEVFSFSLFDNLRKDLVIEVPEAVAAKLQLVDCSLADGLASCEGFSVEEFTVSTASGPVQLADLSVGELVVNTASGRVDLNHISGKEMEVQTASGALEAKNITAENGAFTTVSGQLDLSGNIGELNGSSVSGAITAKLDNCPASGEFDSVSGGITLTIPENEGFRCEYSTVSGNFRSDFPLVTQGKSSEDLTYQNGKADLTFSTTSGDMEIKRAGAKE